MKRELRALLVAYDLAGIGDRAERRTRILGALVPLTYDPDPVVGWRAVEAMGVAAERIAPAAPDAVREHVRRLNWLITEESGGICWRAPEAMAEIVARLPETLAEFVPIVVHLLVETADEDLRHFRAGMLWAIGRLGSAAVPHVRDVLPPIEVCLAHSDPQVRATAAWALSRVGATKLVADRPALRRDEGAVAVYRRGELVRTSVGSVVRALVPGQPDRSS